MIAARDCRGDAIQNSFHRVGTKWLIDATKPALTQARERARFERAMPKNFDDVNLEDFLP
jgi:hypothetical protein